MSTLHFLPSESFRSQVDAVVPQIRALVQEIVADADVQDMGSTAVPGALTKGDLDINVRVRRDDQFRQVVEFLRRRFTVQQPQNWTDGYASFADERSYELPVGIQVTVMGHADDKFLRQRDQLAASTELVESYNKLKMRFQGGDVDAYREAKWAFIETHLRG
jgi:GrpB-like predicted nucleotidyltransferase (UPF0157 family)